jgi:hypothetical protein
MPDLKDTYEIPKDCPYFILLKILYLKKIKLEKIKLENGQTTLRSQLMLENLYGPEDAKFLIKNPSLIPVNQIGRKKPSIIIFPRVVTQEPLSKKFLMLGVSVIPGKLPQLVYVPLDESCDMNYYYIE